jgi:phage terminase large subunit-like protein
VLNGDIADDRFFGVLYAADPDDAWNSERVWKKANPGWGRLVQPDHVRGLAKQAQANPAQRAAFETRHLNRWVAAENPLFDVTLWDRGAWPELDLEALAGEPCFVGLDMGSRVDLAAGAVVWRRFGDDGRPFYIVHAQCWLPAAAVDPQRNPAYVAWAESGALAVNPGETTDYEAIEDWLRELAHKYDVRQIGYDPYMLLQLSQRMANEGLPMLEYRATVLNFSEPTKLLGAEMMSGRIMHNGNPVLRWCIGNTVGHYDARQNVYPKRGNETAKIDAAIALVMAFGAMLNEDSETSEIYRDHDLLVF